MLQVFTMDEENLEDLGRDNYKRPRQVYEGLTGDGCHVMSCQQNVNFIFWQPARHFTDVQSPPEDDPYRSKHVAVTADCVQKCNFDGRALVSFNV